MADEELSPDRARMKRVLDTAGFYSRARIRFRHRVIDEYELARFKRAYDEAVSDYTDPLHRR